MGILDKEVIPSINISSQATVLTYLHPVTEKSAIVLPRITLTGIAANGIYSLAAKVDGINVTPVSSITVPSGETSSFFQSRHVSLEPGDLFTLHIQGQLADTNVASVSVLMDATPIRTAEFDDIIADIDDALGNTTTATLVDHDFGGKDQYAYRTERGAGIADATILVYFTANYNAGQTSPDFAIGKTTTDANGRWRKQVVLEVGDYTLLFYKTRAFGPDTALLTVT